MDEPVSTKPVSEFLFVEVAAQRCMQLMRGARPKIDSDARKYSTLAISEVGRRRRGVTLLLRAALS